MRIAGRPIEAALAIRQVSLCPSARKGSGVVSPPAGQRPHIWQLDGPAHTFVVTHSQ